VDVLICGRYTWIDFSEQVSRRFDSGSGIIPGLFLLNVAFILVWQLASVGRSPAEATISIDFRSGVGSVVPGIGSEREVHD